MNEFELKQSYQLLCDRISNILRNDRRFASQWGGLFLSFGEIDTSFLDGYTGLESYDNLLRAVQENPGGRFDAVQDAMERARELERACRDLLSGGALKNRIAEIRLRLISQTLNACFPADGDGAYRWGPGFELIELPCMPDVGKTYDGCVKCADGRWMRPTEGTPDDNVFRKIGYFSFNSQEKATFAARHYADLFRDWADNELGYRRIEL